MTDSELYNEVMNVDYLTDELYSKMCERCNVEITNNDRFEIKKEPEGPGDGVGFERMRRITGYLSGDYLTRFNNAKLAEVEDRTSYNNRVEAYHERG